MRSPVGNHELRRLEGNASDIWARGDAWVTLGATMKRTSIELTAIGDSSVHKSKGTEKLAELATETAGDLEDAGVRYEETGKVLRTYGTALSVAQTWIHPRIDDIEAAENGYQDAMTAKEDAENAQNGLDHRWPWESEPSDAQRSAAGDAVDTATTDLRSATGDRNELWGTFDTTFETWSDAYDDAVDGIQKAMDTADNNDGFWEFVDNLIDAITVILIVLTIVALIIGAPFTGLLALTMLVLAVASLALTLLKFAYGRATLSDVAWSALALLPFGIGKLLAKGAPALGGVISGGRGVVTQAIRAGLPKVSLLRPSTWLSPARSLFAPVTSWLHLPRPGMLVNPFRSIVMGGPEGVQIQSFLSTMRNSQWASNPAVVGFIEGIGAKLPGAFAQYGNITNWVGNMGLAITDLVNVQGPMPGLSDVRVGG